MLSTKQKTDICNFAYIWCIANLRKSKYHEGIPRIFIRSKKTDSFLKGYYKEGKNLITVYLQNHTSGLDLCETIIHEWKHYQQNIASMYDKYEVVYRRKGRNHPYEITAENYAKKHGKKCNTWVRLMTDK